MDEFAENIAMVVYGLEPDRTTGSKRRDPTTVEYTDKRPILSARVIGINRFSASLRELEGSDLEASLAILKSKRRNLEEDAIAANMDFPYEWDAEELRYRPLFKRHNSITPK